MSPARPVGIAELHLHFEGSLSIASAIELAAKRNHPWGELTAPELRKRFRYDGFGSFLMAVKGMAEVLCSIEALERNARELSCFLARHGVAYAEVYVSPYIYVAWGLDGNDVMQAVDRGFAAAEAEGGARCAILLDSVRQWGPEAAERVLDLHESTRLDRVAGFGLGGEESVPFEEFRGIYDRARALGLHTLAHAGEAGNPADVAKAIDMLGVERVAHGFRALDDPVALGRLRASGVPLDLAVTSNYRTGVVRGAHPIRRLLDEGIPVTLSTDDPSLFRVDLPREYRRVRRLCGVSESEAREIARNAVRFSFADSRARAALLEELEHRFA
jgi:aminodeoxyfutalosine deaminase